MRWKWIVGIIAAAFVVLLVVVYIIAASYDFNSLKPLITDAAREYTGRELTMGGDIDLTIGFPPTLEVHDIAFQNASWGSQPQMAQLKKIQVKISILPLIRGNVNVDRLILIEPKFLLEVNKSGKSNLDFNVAKKAESPEAEEKASSDSLMPFELEEVEIKDGNITYKDHRTGQTKTVILASLDLKSPLFGDGADIDIKGSYNKTPFQLNGNIGLLSRALKSNEKWPLKLEVQAVKTKVSVEGSIQDLMTARGIDLKLNVEGDDLAEFEKFTGEPLPVKGPFQLSGHFVSPSDNEVQVSDLLVVLGESQIQGTVKVTHAAKRPLIEAKLSSKKLDLRPVMGNDTVSVDSKNKSAADKPGKDKVFPDTPLKLDALHLVDALIQLTATRVMTPHLAFDDFLVDLSLKDGVLNIKQLKAGGEKGGKLAGNMELAAHKASTTLDLKLKIDDLDLGDMVKKMDISEGIEGALDLDIDLAGQGNSVAALMAGLNGHLIASMGESKMPVSYLNLVSADLSSSLLKIVNPFEEKIERAQINCAVCGFSIKDGMANGDAIIIDDPQKTLISHGTLNLKTETLDFGVQTKPKGGIGTKETGKINISLSEITKPFKLGGTLANPSLGISPERTITILGTALLGPGGIASLFVSGSHGDQNPCVVALQKAKEHRADGKGTTPESSDAKKKEGLGSKIKNLFSKPKE
jgi:uncharacterized protein involved in outer membrane biogenesis